MIHTKRKEIRNGCIRQSHRWVGKSSLIVLSQRTVQSLVFFTVIVFHKLQCLVFLWKETAGSRSNAYIHKNGSVQNIYRNPEIQCYILTVSFVVSVEFPSILHLFVHFNLFICNYTFFKAFVISRICTKLCCKLFRIISINAMRLKFLGFKKKKRLILQFLQHALFVATRADCTTLLLSRWVTVQMKETSRIRIWKVQKGRRSRPKLSAWVLHLVELV
jgi:hypothetical protein